MTTEQPDSLQNIVSLPSTAKGLVGKYIRNAFFLVAGAIGASMLYPESPEATRQSTLEITRKYEAGELSRNEYNQLMDALPQENRKQEDQDKRYGLIGFSIISGLVAAGNAYRLIDNRNQAKRVNKVDTANGRISEQTFWLPYGAGTTDIQIDKITKVETSQTSIGRLLDTGSVEIHGVVYTAAGSKDVIHTIPYIADPLGAKAKILQMLPERAGLELRLRPETRASQPA